MNEQPKDLMTLEETIFGLNEMLRYDSAQKWPFKLNDDDKVSITSAIHRLNSEMKECKCASFLMAQHNRTDNEAYGKLISKWDGKYHAGCDLPPLAFCPWCGGKVPTAQEVNP